MRPQAVDVLEFLKQDRAIREQNEAREKGMRDFWSQMETQRDKGREEGREEGRQNLRAVARALLAMGVSREKVARATQLSTAEVEALERA